MGPESVFIVVLATAVAVLLSRALSARTGLPEAILLVVLGAAIAFLPGMPEIELPPEVVLLGFLPPLVYYAAFFSAPREAKADAVPITALAIGLTTVTTFAVAAVLRGFCPTWAGRRPWPSVPPSPPPTPSPQSRS
ncbi:hypothetical protein ACFQY7_04875 [Actinomadura luteofluorescens]|uniref:hypothetical protein n=1 Tax=Actinomadura luteofluorescens TaxID=46163 RepID=UPI0036261959